MESYVDFQLPGYGNFQLPALRQLPTSSGRYQPCAGSTATCALSPAPTFNYSGIGSLNIANGRHGWREV
jgi:hypothetical protein